MVNGFVRMLVGWYRMIEQNLSGDMSPDTALLLPGKIQMEEVSG
jgi:hypothetical protein